MTPEDVDAWEFFVDLTDPTDPDVPEPRIGTISNPMCSQN